LPQPLSKSHLSKSSQVNGDQSNSSKRSTFEDIYGRIRDSDTREIVEDNRGVVEPGTKDKKVTFAEEVEEKPAQKPIQTKYVPPSLRAKMAKHTESLDETRLKSMRQIKGLLNRLSEANVASIATGIEQLYAGNSRNVLTTCLTELVLEACVPDQQTTPPRFLLEHALLIGVLHHTVGPEVGANILQECAKMFEQCKSSDTKRSDNVVGLLCGLYLFKVVHASLLFDVVKSLTTSFKEKDVELILIIFRNIGFYLRKDDPAELKVRLTELQQKAAQVKKGQSAEDQAEAGYSKVQFMLDILLAVKNNNMTKIPNYDAETPERMTKSLRSTLAAKKSSKGENSLHVRLDELLQADKRGKWWIVGSAWEGRQAAASDSASADPLASSMPKLNDETLAKIERLAVKQRMNTQLRKTIFAILLTAEDYVDAFQRLLKLNLNEKQEREIVFVLGSVCLNEKSFNSYYAFLAQKFCTYHKRFRITFKYWFWDQYRELTGLPERKAINLARLLAHLLLDGDLELTVFKVVEFYQIGELKTLSTFMMTALVTFLTAEDESKVTKPFKDLAKSPKLSVLRQSLLLYFRHFLGQGLDEVQGAKVKDRIDLVSQYLKK